MQSKLTKKAKQEIVKRIDNYYTKSIKSILKFSNKDNVGGKIRQAMGDLGENLAKVVWLEVAKLYADISNPIEPKRGEDDIKKCISKRGYPYDAHVDKHCYIKDKFVLAIESKSYLDSCYYTRASADFRLLKEYYDPKLICIVLSIEDATKESSRLFIEDEGWIDGTFILADGKRTSAKPIWNKKFLKKLNHTKIAVLIEYIDKIFCRHLKTK